MTDVGTTRSDDSRLLELERRIEALDVDDAGALGRFTTWDWALCVVFAVVLPLLLVWWFAP